MGNKQSFVMGMLTALAILMLMGAGMFGGDSGRYQAYNYMSIGIAILDTQTGEMTQVRPTVGEWTSLPERRE